MKLGRIAAIVAALFFCLLIPQSSLFAQSEDSCYAERGVDWWNYYPPLDETCSCDESWIHCTCGRRTFSCPSKYSELSGCPKCEGGKPIDFSTGNTTITQTDVSLPGLGGGISLVRTYNSRWPNHQLPSRTGMFGSQWRSSYEERVYKEEDGSIAYSRSDGSFWYLGYDSGGSKWRVNAPSNVDVTLVVTETEWTITFHNGEKRVFQPHGRLQQIIDRNGNTTQLSYDSLGRLVRVTDPALRHLDFGYVENGFLVTSVTSSLGVFHYTYDGLNRLATVTKPDSTSMSFESSGSAITAVKDSAGKILESHTYDECGRGLTSSQANGVDSLTVTYGWPCGGMIAASQ